MTQLVSFVKIGETMSKKYEVKSCKECPSIYFDDKTTQYMCKGYEGKILDWGENGIIDDCPLEDYHAEEYDFKSSVPVINRHAIKSAFGIKERSPIRQVYDTHISTPEQVTPAPVEMKELVTIIEYSFYNETYFAPDGNYHTNHPDKLNQFIQRVNESGGNIISMQMLADQKRHQVHYTVPVRTDPISV